MPAQFLESLVAEAATEKDEQSTVTGEGPSSVAEIAGEEGVYEIDELYKEV